MTVHGDSSGVDAFLKEWRSPDTAFIEAHTSGSTGTPKRIMLAKSDMTVSARATNKFFCITSRSTMLMPLSHDYIAGKMMIVRAELAGCDLYVEKPSMTPISDEPYPAVFDLVPVVPAQLHHLLSSPRYPSMVRNLLIGGGAIPAEVERAVIDAGFNAYASYGMTETCSHVALRKLGCNVYTAMPGIVFSVDKDNSLTIQSHDYSWKSLQTNDVVDLIDNRTFIWRGRRDFVINSGGVKLYPEEIERKIESVMNTPFYITSTPDSVWGEAVTLVYEKVSGKVVSDKELMEACRPLLSRYELPKIVIAVDVIDRTSSGKLIRSRNIIRTC